MKQTQPFKDMPFGAQMMTVGLYLAAGGVAAVALGLLVKAIRWAWS